MKKKNPSTKKLLREKTPGNQSRSRMSFEKRRVAIIQALIPLLESKSPDQLTTKDIAVAANISEALLYQHFKSKTEIFHAVHDVLCQKVPSLDRAIREAKPSTEWLFLSFYLLAWISLKKPSAVKIDPLFPRLMMQSLLGDQTFAKMHRQSRLESLCDLVVKSLAQAQKEGALQPGIDYINLPERAHLAFWNGVHLITMVYLNTCSDQENSVYPKGGQVTIDSTVGFVLLGAGVRNEVLKNVYISEQFEKTLMGLIISTANEKGE